ncbi:beta-glucanase (GH16 family) [Anseongella ginsenosidimutans]|uniref:Beta-glucanase (GH16 family) n=1 Tax=Anseongella ginsenosidimutans TaxID=496056 RepID=A0A4R3KT78_9SPHI|nr:glycoside hydrolase family 16 protein [Anseongella ginsenosidimutans]QEC53190.1 glycoside hydrolase family 16 protein [Anseongella ginsenosidimutans]TCS87819.1 beta-glucanase (GH16 family) [Anseongella ginsenosidimutans]
MKTNKIFITLLCFLVLAGLTCNGQENPSGIKTDSPFRNLVWSDEFNYQGLPDSGKWVYETGYVRNNELQYYTRARPENARVEKGNLVIQARNDSLVIDGKAHPVTSASITTQGRRDWTYGRIEVRAKLPGSKGTWPAIWMLGSNITEVGWPDCGEIDIMEHVGYMPDTIHVNVHTGKYNHADGTGKGGRTHVQAPFENFHLYAIEWMDDRIDFFVDEKKVFTFRNEGTGNAAWPYDKPHYLILNLAFGGAWGAARGVDINSLPQTYLVDYVRVYQ